MNEVFRQVQEWTKQYNMFPPSGRVIVALSGGADSMAMAHLLLQLLPAERILCAHVNHGIRGEEADKDEAFVRSWCEHHGLALQVLHADVPAEAHRSGEGLEACGRRLRYAFFEELACAENDRIATAHTRSDQAETVLLHLIQGAGARGLSGIPPVRGKIIRPVLCLSRADIEAYCLENQLAFRTDSTNSDLAYTRNRLRHQVLPLLQEMNPSLEKSLERAALSLGRDAACLEQMAQQVLQTARMQSGLSVVAFDGVPDAVAIRALAVYFEESGCLRPEAVHLEQALTALRKGGGRLDLPGGLELNVWRDRLCLARIEALPVGCTELRITGPQTKLWDGRVLFLEIFPVSEIKNRIKFHNLLFPILMDYDTITHSRKILTVRTRRAGDRFSPAGRGISKSLKKLFSEQRVPTALRDHLLLLEMDGEVLWVEGFGVCDRCKVQPDTQKVLMVRIELLKGTVSDTE